MKKFFYSVLAAATMLFATTSCSQEDEILGGASQSGNTQKVTFTVQMPDEGVGSRAIAEGVNVGGGNKADNLIWALYEKDKKDDNGNPIRLDYGHVTGTKNSTTGKHEFTADITMVKGLTYNVLFFAYDDEKCAFQLASTVEETDLTALTLKNDLVANEEGYDAFVKCHPYTFGGETDVVLNRPFAQVNAATTVADLDKALKLQAVVTKSELVIKNVPTQYNVLTGETTAKANLTYKANPILTKYPAVTNGHPNEDIIVTENGFDNTYKYLTMAYVLAGETATSDASTHEASFNFYRGTNGDDLMRTIDIINLPIQRNWRTNVVGALLTEEESFKITIDHIFNGDHNVDGEGEDATTTTVATAAELQAAIDAASGPTIIKFEHDIDANSSRSAVASITIKQKEGVDLVIDGCGYKFNGVMTVNGDGRSTGKETLTFNNINFETTDSDTDEDTRWSFIDAPSKLNGKYNYSHNVTIENCTFTNTVETTYHVGSASFTGTYNLEMKNCTATNMHSILQVQSCDNTAVVDNIKTINCKNGVSFGNTAYPTISNSEINSNAYGIRGDGNATRGNLVIKNTTINANVPVIIRKVTTDGYKVALEGNTVLTTTGEYQVVFTKGDDEDAYVEPTVTYSISGAEGLKMFPVRIKHEESGLIYNGVDQNWKSVFYLYSAEDFQKAATYFTGQTHTSEANGVTLVLENDVDFNNAEWTPWSVMWITLEGNNHTISNVKVTEGWRSGFFGYLGASKVNNLTLENVNVTGAQVGAFAGSVEGVTTTNVKIAGTNNVTYKEYASETWGGIGAVTGVLADSKINVEIVEGARVALDCGAIETEAPFHNYLSGYLQENKGTIVNNGSWTVKTSSPIVANSIGTGYTGDLFEPGATDFFVLQNSTLSGDATITIKRTYATVALEGVTAELDEDVIVAEADNTIVLHGCNFKLAEGKKLVATKEGITVGQVMIHDVTVNGEKLTQATAAQYLQGVNWYEVW